MSQSTLARALAVMDEASKSPEGLRFSDVQRMLGGPSPTTVNKILKELTRADALRKNREGRYVVGMKAWFWARSAVASGGPMQVVRGCMEELRLRFDASVNLFTCSGDHMLCLESATSPLSPSLWPAGSGVPLELPVIGAVFFLPQERLDDAAFLRAECARHDQDMDMESVQRMVREARRTGVQYDAGLFYPGVCRLAVPILEQGRIAMVLGFGVLEARVPDDHTVDRMTAAMLETKARIEQNLS